MISTLRPRAGNQAKSSEELQLEKVTAQQRYAVLTIICLETQTGLKLPKTG